MNNKSFSTYLWLSTIHQIKLKLHTKKHPSPILTESTPMITMAHKPLNLKANLKNIVVHSKTKQYRQSKTHICLPLGLVILGRGTLNLKLLTSICPQLSTLRSSPDNLNNSRLSKYELSNANTFHTLHCRCTSCPACLALDLKNYW